MKKKIENLICWLWVGVALLVIVAGCQKHKQNTIVGDWQTITTIGFKFDYQITDNGILCRQLPDVFGSTKFCNDFTQDGDTLFIAANIPEKWVIKFECENVVSVTSTIDGGVSQFIITRR